MIDWAQVKELQGDMGDSFDEIVEVFLLEVAEGIARLDTGSGTGSMAADLHFLRGAALNLGFVDFARLCAQGEEQAIAGKGNSVDLDAVRASYHASRREFVAGLTRRAA